MGGMVVLGVVPVFQVGAVSWPGAFLGSGPGPGTV